MTAAERDSYDNLILLCLDHHKIIDDDPIRWSVEELHAMKTAHEQRMSARLSEPDKRSIQVELLYAAWVSEWEAMACLDDWTRWTSTLFEPTPGISTVYLDHLDAVARWLFSRPWPGTKPVLEAALENFLRVANDLRVMCRCGMEEFGGQTTLRVRPEYKKRMMTQDEYDEEAVVFDWLADIFPDMAYELTRAANRVCNEVRLSLDGNFRASTGLLTVEVPGNGLFTILKKPRYSSPEDEYLNLEDFVLRRAKRDLFYGSCPSAEGLQRIRPLTFPG